MILQPYLIQTGSIRQNVENKRVPLSQRVNFDYMGSAEFENGAIRRSLIALGCNRNHIKVRAVPEIKLRIDGEDGPSLRALSPWSDASWEEYKAHLIRMWGDGMRLKEPIRFRQVEVSVGNPANLRFWWDLENHVMWSFNRPFMKQIHTPLQLSWEVIGL